MSVSVFPITGISMYTTVFRLWGFCPWGLMSGGILSGGAFVHALLYTVLYTFSRIKKNY